MVSNAGASTQHFQDLCGRYFKRYDGFDEGLEVDVQLWQHWSLAGSEISGVAYLSVEQQHGPLQPPTRILEILLPSLGELSALSAKLGESLLVFFALKPNTPYLFESFAEPSDEAIYPVRVGVRCWPEAFRQRKSFSFKSFDLLRVPHLASLKRLVSLLQCI
ncbi:MAG TPA: hypothetical protein VMF89_32560 [Polyangiales bacterium]|nr:hypothetical protein [Polyangiales bacterium]